MPLLAASGKQCHAERLLLAAAGWRAYPSGMASRILTTWLVLASLSIATPLLFLGVLKAETPAPPAGQVPPGLSKLLTDLAREQVPRTYDDDRHWGQTTKLWAGLKVEREGLKIETRPRYIDVNHGTWTKYHLELIDPDKNLDVQILEMRTDGGEAVCKVQVTARVRCDARVSEWQRGIQLISLSTVALAKIRLTADCVLGLSLDPSKFPPDVLLQPKVRSAKLALLDFEVREVSKARGELAEQLGGGLERILKDKLADYEQKLPEKANKAIAKKQDKLRLSLADLAQTGWQKLLGQ